MHEEEQLNAGLAQKALHTGASARKAGVLPLSRCFPILQDSRPASSGSGGLRLQEDVRGSCTPSEVLAREFAHHFHSILFIKESQKSVQIQEFKNRL